MCFLALCSTSQESRCASTYGRVLLCHRKEWFNCKWSKPDTESQIPHVLSHMWKLQFMWQVLVFYRECNGVTDSWWSIIFCVDKNGGVDRLKTQRYMNKCFSVFLKKCKYYMLISNVINYKCFKGTCTLWRMEILGEKSRKNKAKKKKRW